MSGTAWERAHRHLALVERRALLVPDRVRGVQHRLVEPHAGAQHQPLGLDREHGPALRVGQAHDDFHGQLGQPLRVMCTADDVGHLIDQVSSAHYYASYVHHRIR